MKPIRCALRSLFLLLTPALALAGCAHKDTIVGKWQGTVTQPGGTMNSTFGFTQDGKETISGQLKAGTMTMAISAAGTYTVSGTNLTQNLTSITIGTRTSQIPTPQAKTGLFTLDGDHLTLSNPGNNQVLTLTRVKE